MLKRGSGAIADSLKLLKSYLAVSADASAPERAIEPARAPEPIPSAGIGTPTLNWNWPPNRPPNRNRNQPRSRRRRNAAPEAAS